jgi:hypothetical protein
MAGLVMRISNVMLLYEVAVIYPTNMKFDLTSLDVV